MGSGRVCVEVLFFERNLGSDNGRGLPKVLEAQGLGARRRRRLGWGNLGSLQGSGFRVRFGRAVCMFQRFDFFGANVLSTVGAVGREFFDDFGSVDCKSGKYDSGIFQFGRCEPGGVCWDAWAGELIKVGVKSDKAIMTGRGELGRAGGKEPR